MLVTCRLIASTSVYDSIPVSQAVSDLFRMSVDVNVDGVHEVLLA